ncbi:MAG: ParB N-terminal domain-containing protein [bacterium]|nr:ParB N-terminal domain-containing protein [bacterium]
MRHDTIDMSLVKVDPNNPRKVFSEKSIENLAKSLKVEGLIHQIEVDGDYVIIVGELRYRAAKLLGWTKIGVTINDGSLPPYERLRRQMAENLQQSGAKGGGESMNAVDTAKAWASLYELKTGEKYEPGSHLFETGRGIKGPFLQIAEEVGVSKENVWQYLNLLSQPKYVVEDLLKGRPRTYYREADMAPDGVKEKIKEKIAAGDYDSRDQISRDVAISKKIPDFSVMELERQKAKESSFSNKILNIIANLGLSLEKQPLSQIDDLREKELIKNQLIWIKSKIEDYLGSERSVQAEEGE